MKISLVLLFCVFALSLVPKASAGAECVICEFVVEQVENFISSNATESEVLAALDSACNLLKVQAFVEECKALINSEGPVLVKYIINEETPEVACSQTGFCNNSRIAVVAPKVGGAIECGTCTFLVGAIEHYVSENATEAQILKFLEADCKVFKDPSWVSTCNGTVKTFGPEIINLVLQKLPADKVCTQVGLCPSSSSSKPKAKPAIVAVDASQRVGNASGLECTICEFLVQYAEKYLGENKTEGEILQGLEDICAVFHIKGFVADCKNIVAEYGALIIKYLVNEEPPEQACSSLKLCPSSSSRISLKPATVKCLGKKC